MIYLLSVWLLIELTTQAARWGVVKVWRIPLWGNRGGMTLHPLLIFIDDPLIVDHEMVHVEQMTRFTWTLWIILYVFSGRWRVKFEAQAYCRETGWRGRAWISKMAEKIRGPIYFQWWIPGRDPGQWYAEKQIRRYL